MDTGALAIQDGYYNIILTCICLNDLTYIPYMYFLVAVCIPVFVHDVRLALHVCFLPGLGGHSLVHCVAT